MKSVYYLIGVSEEFKQQLSAASNKDFLTPPEFISVEGEMDDASRTRIFNSIREVAAGGYISNDRKVPVFAIVSDQISADALKSAMSFLYVTMEFRFSLHPHILLCEQLNLNEIGQTDKLEMWKLMQTEDYRDSVACYPPRNNGDDSPWNVRGRIVRMLVVLRKDTDNCKSIAMCCSLFANGTEFMDDYDGTARVYTMSGLPITSHTQYIKACARKAFYDHVFETIEGDGDVTAADLKIGELIEDLVEKAQHMVCEYLPRPDELMACMTTGNSASVGDELQYAEKRIFGERLQEAFSTGYSPESITSALNSINDKLKKELRRGVYAILKEAYKYGIQPVSAAIRGYAPGILQDNIRKAEKKVEVLKSDINAAGIKHVTSVKTGLFCKQDPSIAECIDQIFTEYYSKKIRKMNNDVNIAIFRELNVLVRDYTGEMLRRDLAEVKSGYLDEYRAVDRDAKIMPMEKEQIRTAYEKIDDEIYNDDSSIESTIINTYCDAMSEGRHDNCKSNIRQAIDDRLNNKLDGIEDLPCELRLRERLLRLAGKDDPKREIYSMLTNQASAQNPPFTIDTPVKYLPWQTDPERNKLYLFMGTDTARYFDKMDGIRMITTENEKEVYVLRIWVDNRINQLA